VTALLGVAMARLVFHALVHHDPLSLRILVLGSGAQATQLMQLRRRSDWRGLNVVGYVRMPNEQAAVVLNRVMDVKTNLLDLAREHDVDEIVIAVDNRRKTFPIEDLLECEMSGIRVTELSTFIERQFGQSAWTRSIPAASSSWTASVMRWCENTANVPLMCCSA
jgi:FlaA1/EpsC-like NDP-sugar epimerase